MILDSIFRIHQENTMTMPNSGAITGAAQTGFTSPTYTMTADTPPSQFAKQGAILALGGTQTGVSTHSVSDPFTISVFRPTVLKPFVVKNAITGIGVNVPKNDYKVIGRKGALPFANNPYQVIQFKTTFSVPAGVDSYSPAEVRGLTSCYVGYLWANSAGLGDTLVQGTI